MIKNLGDFLLDIRIEAGLTQRELASLVGTYPTSISQYERDINCPKVYTFEDILNACGYELVIKKKGSK